MFDLIEGSDLLKSQCGSLHLKNRFRENLVRNYFQQCFKVKWPYIVEQFDIFMSNKYAAEKICEEIVFEQWKIVSIYLESHLVGH